MADRVMSKQVIQTGTTPADGTGDSVRTAFNKVNANFTEVYEMVEAAASEDALQEHIEDTNNPHGVTKSQVGLPNVDNTSDANKPVSNATQTALNAKASTAALATETNARTAADATNASAIAAETTARIAADALKADLASPDFTGNPTAPTQASGNNSGRLANTAFVKAAIDDLVAGAPGALDTLKEISDQLANDESAVSALTVVVASKVPAIRTVNNHPLTADVIVTKSDVGLGNADNTSDSSKPVSTAQQTALNLKQDKNTLGADSAAAVHAATAKATPADADEFGYADSAASFGLKKFTWSNIKAALKTYFDGLYNLYVLPAPGTTTLGGVKRNAGSAGQFVNGIDSVGALTYGTPAGGSGGGLVRGSGVLQGNTIPHGSPTPVTGYSVNVVNSIGTGTLTVDVYGTVVTMTFDTVDPADGSIFIDTSTFSGSIDYATAIYNMLTTTLAAYVANVTLNEFNITFDSLYTGSTTYVNVTTTMPNIGTSGYIMGTDGTPGSGAVAEVVLIPAVSGKNTFPVRVILKAGGDGSIPGTTADVCLKEGGVYYPLCNEFAPGGVDGEILGGVGSFQIGSYTTRWMNGLFQGALVARLTATPGDGGSVTFTAICEQQVP